MSEFWTKARLSLASKLRHDGLTFLEISVRLGCSPSAVRGVIRRRERPLKVNIWSRDEFDTLQKMREQGATWAAIGLALNRSTEAVKGKARLREYVPPKPSHEPQAGKGWPSVGFDLARNDDRYVAKLLKAAKLEGCYGPSSARRAA